MIHGNTLPIRQLTLYKHGVAFVQRQAAINGQDVELVFRASEVNDALKSLLVVDGRDGQVLGIHYETPTSGAHGTQSPIVLSPEHSLLDLLRALRGWLVRLVVETGEDAQDLSGRLLGIDLPDSPAAMAQAVVAVLDEETGAVRMLPLRHLQAVVLLEARAQADLSFFLQTSRSDAAHRTMTIRLSPGEHDLTVSYLIPSPSWRVSYRVAADSAAAKGQAPAAAPGAESQDGSLLLQGWGLFDNPFEEDLHDVAVTLTAGQPISFVYHLAESSIPERPVVADISRIASGPVNFEFPSTAGALHAAAMPAPKPGMQKERASARMLRAPMSDELAQQSAAATGVMAGELFQYNVVTPVTVQRGESTLVPIMSARLPYARELLFSEAKLPGHPVAALRCTNTSGLVLEHGPVTIVEDGTYRGEAILEFTREGQEVYLAFAVELGINITLSRDTTNEIATIRIEGSLLHTKHATLQRVTYRVENTLASDEMVTIEHPLWQGADLVDTPPPTAQTASTYRWKIACPARTSILFQVTERRYNWQVSELLDLSYARLEGFLKARWLDAQTLDRIKALLDKRSAMTRNNAQIQHLESERHTIDQREEQLRANMTVLGKTGEEDNLRRQMVSRLRESEERIVAIATQLSRLQEENTRHQAAIEAELAGLSVNNGAPE